MQKSIDNPSGWIKHCIKEEWHKHEKLETLSPSERNAHIIKTNKQLAQEVLSPHLKEEIPLSLKTDFVEFGKEQYPIFYWEEPEVFQKKIKHVIRALGLKDCAQTTASQCEALASPGCSPTHGSAVPG